MTVKQLLVGGILGATAVGIMIHRLPKNVLASLKLNKPMKTALHEGPNRKSAGSERISVTKIYG